MRWVSGAQMLGHLTGSTSGCEEFPRLFLQVNALKHISLRPHPNFIKFIEDFKVNERPCLVFELLHMDLLEFTKHHETCIANLKAVRPIAQQVRVPKGTDLAPNFTSVLNTEELFFIIIIIILLQ